jgi:hypothetical protein
VPFASGGIDDITARHSDLQTTFALTETAVRKPNRKTGDDNREES